MLQSVCFSLSSSLCAFCSSCQCASLSAPASQPLPQLQIVCFSLAPVCLLIRQLLDVCFSWNSRKPTFPSALVCLLLLHLHPFSCLFLFQLQSVCFSCRFCHSASSSVLICLLLLQLQSVSFSISSWMSASPGSCVTVSRSAPICIHLSQLQSICFS
jgi:hypothetical protein